jgi:hypothetical protein
MKINNVARLESQPPNIAAIAEPTTPIMLQKDTFILSPSFPYKKQPLDFI